MKGYVFNLITPGLNRLAMSYAYKHLISNTVLVHSDFSDSK